ncbi:uncharacterized protein LOC117337018 isoform X2 [Pecten maximus]|uniref:uncharacterized protein LOC117337018 isoform X2 n=1 Tax=Pecten maximus TaxID=6579 RepID=UPI001458BAC9|nr:uncharacterized protein LOC117337018 isoform X2 [Pecten maximus]
MALVLVLCMTSLWSIAQAVKIQTYNVGLINHIDNYKIRKRNIIRELKSGDYDVMCLQEETMLWGSINAPPCHNAPLTTLDVLYNCAFLANDLAALAKCVTERDLMTESQGCITCLLVSGWDVSRCFNYIAREAINIPGLVLLSKRKIDTMKTVEFEPGVKQISKRAYIEAEIEGVGTVFCSHSTSNSNIEYYEPFLQDVYSSLAEQNLNDSRKLTDAANLSDKPVILGDLNTGPVIPAFNVSAEFEDSYNHFLSEGFSSPYVTMVQKCTFCSLNPLVKNWETNEVLDHVLIRNHTVLSAKRLFVQNIPRKNYPMSDHYGVEVEIGN